MVTKMYLLIFYSKFSRQILYNVLHFLTTHLMNLFFKIETSSEYEPILTYIYMFFIYC